MSDRSSTNGVPIRTVCLTCGGAGTVSRPKMAIVQGRAVTLVTQQRCTHCPPEPDDPTEGRGWLPGFQAPV